MKIPNQVQVGPYNYLVVVKNNVISGDELLSGLADHRHGVIELEEDRAPKLLEETFLHELLHCIAFVTGTNEILNEELIDHICPTLFDTLERNGLLNDIHS